MILYDLTCPDDHCFESWFRNSNAVAKLLDAGGISCPVCGSTKLKKALMAPRIAKSSGSDEKAITTTSEPKPEIAAAMEKAAQAFAELRTAIEKNFENVGGRFSEEARRIHYGEAEARGIYGEASGDEADALREEGIEVYSIPVKKRRTHS